MRIRIYCEITIFLNLKEINSEGHYISYTYISIFQLEN